jgi:hypothetical protein
MLSFKDKIREENEETTKADLVEMLNDLLEGSHTDEEFKLYDMLLHFVETGVFTEDIYPVLFDVIERITEGEEGEDVEASEENKRSFSEEDIQEVIKRVVRGGKRVKKKICPKGKKASGGKCVVMTSKEKRTRGKAATKAHRTNKAAFKKGVKKAVKIRKRFYSK